MVAQERLLGADHQEAHDVVADVGEDLHLGPGEVGCAAMRSKRSRSGSSCGVS